MNKLKHRLTTAILGFAFPLFMALAVAVKGQAVLVYIVNSPGALFEFAFLVAFGVQASFAFLAWAGYLIWKGE